MNKHGEKLMDEGNFDEAHNVFLEAFEIAPEAETTHITYAICIGKSTK